jgi:hypothetical protein
MYLIVSRCQQEKFPQKVAKMASQKSVTGMQGRFFAFELSRAFPSPFEHIDPVPKSASRVDVYINQTRRAAQRADRYPSLTLFSDYMHNVSEDHTKRYTGPKQGAIWQVTTRSNPPEVYTINSYQSVANVFDDQEMLKKRTWPLKSIAPRRMDFHLWNSFGVKQMVLRQLVDVDDHFVRQLKWVSGRGQHGQATDESRLRARIPAFVKALTGSEPEGSGNPGELVMVVRKAPGVGLWIFGMTGMPKGES